MEIGRLYLINAYNPDVYMKSWVLHKLLAKSISRYLRHDYERLQVSC